MLHQPTIAQSPHHHHHHHRVSLSSSSLSHSTSFPSGFPNFPLIQTNASKKKHPFITFSISHAPGYGTLEDKNKRPMVKWNVIYKKISLTQDPEISSVSVLNQWENEGKKLGKWELYRVVKELRIFGRYKPALEVFDWMKERGDKYRISTSDTAIEVDLIAMVRGIPSAEDYFLKLPASSKDKRVYEALLNAYAHARMREKAESLITQMKDRGYATHALPFNVMMTLYMNLKDYDKVESIVSEMMEKQILLDKYSYNNWLSSRGSHGSTERMEEVFEHMKLDRTIKPSWTTFSTMATMYAKTGQLGKAEDCLRRLENKIKGRDRIAYHSLISVYGFTGNKFEVHRVWNTYKSIFPYIPNMGYYYVISSLVRLDDIEGAEKIYAEWVSVKPVYDTRIANLLMGWYIRNCFFGKAEAFFEGIAEAGGKPDSNTWEILAGGLIGERRVSEALTCFNEALLAMGSKFWKPKPANVNLILKMCEQENDIASKEDLMGILRQVGCLEDDSYMSAISIPNGTRTGNRLPVEKEKAGDGDVDEMLLNQFQESL